METLNFFTRLWLAFVLPWKLLFDGAFAARVQRLASGLEPDQQLEPTPPTAEPVQPVTQVEAERDESPALQLLSILQREGRLIDFLQEDLSGASDADIGAAARVVHDGCKRGLDEYLKLAPIRKEEEGARVTLETGYDARETRVTGKVLGEPPFNGTLAHHGWRVTSLHLPTLSEEHDPRIVAPAEVEL